MIEFYLKKKVIDFSDFEKFLVKINTWCNETDPDIITDLNDLLINQSILVKHISVLNKQPDDLIWKRSKIVTIQTSKYSSIIETFMFPLIANSLIFINQSELVFVFLIDEGILVECKLNDLRIDLPDFYNKFEPQAKKCRLKDAQPQVHFCLIKKQEILNK